MRLYEEDAVSCVAIAIDPHRKRHSFAPVRPSCRHGTDTGGEGEGQGDHSLVVDGGEKWRCLLRVSGAELFRAGGIPLTCQEGSCLGPGHWICSSDFY